MPTQPKGFGSLEGAAEGHSEMFITLNGESHTIRKGSTVRSLLDQLELEGDRVAVELDRQIVRRAEWDVTRIRPCARVEVVQFVGGG